MKFRFLLDFSYRQIAIAPVSPGSIPIIRPSFRDLDDFWTGLLDNAAAGLRFRAFGPERLCAKIHDNVSCRENRLLALKIRLTLDSLPI